MKRLLTSVLSEVPGELIRSGKLPSASFPGALVGFLTSVSALVGFQVARLGVNLAAPREEAEMAPSSLAVFRLCLFP